MLMKKGIKNTHAHTDAVMHENLTKQKHNIHMFFHTMYASAITHSSDHLPKLSF